MITRSAEANRVPPDLMMAIAHIEGGLKLAPMRVIEPDDAVPIAGVLELRHGRFNSLAHGAKLMAMSEVELSADLSAGTEAGARVLDDLALQLGISNRGDPAAWAPVVEMLSGHLFERDQIDYRAQVFRLLRYGGALEARAGEVILLPARADVPVGLTLAPPPLAPLGEPEYPGALWFETSCVDKCRAYRNGPISMIAIHDTEGGWNASVATLQNDPLKSVHYIVDKDGSRVGQFIPESYTGWQVGNTWYNARMVGIEHVGKASEDDYQTEMYVTSADLAKTIAARYALPLNRQTVVAHMEVPNGNQIPADSPPCPDSPSECMWNTSYGGMSHHTDPGIYWEWGQYMDLLGGQCRCNDVSESWSCVHDRSMMFRCANGDVELVRCADPCQVDALGSDDSCTPIPEPTIFSSSTSGSSLSNPTAGAGGHGGAPSGGEAGGDQGLAIHVHATANGMAPIRGSCAVGPVQAAPSSLGAARQDGIHRNLWAAALVLTAIARRRRRSPS